MPVQRVVQSLSSDTFLYFHRRLFYLFSRLGEYLISTQISLTTHIVSDKILQDDVISFTARLRE